MAESELRLTGMDELMKKLEALGTKSKKIESAALLAGGEVLKQGVQREIVSQGLTRSWDMHDGMKVSDVKTSNGTKFVWVGDVDRVAIYSWYIEFGTPKMDANPFLSRSLVMYETETKAAMAKVIKEGLGL
jgi:HK97 gp10 family phage protein